MVRFHPLSLLRRFAARLGETGSILLILILLPANIQILDPHKGPAWNIPFLLTLIILCVAIYARKKDSDGHKAMKRQREEFKKNAPASSPNMARNLEILGLTENVTADDIKTTARTLIRDNHPDTARGTTSITDIGQIVEARDALLTVFAAQNTTINGKPSATQQLNEWRIHAGFLGSAWGALLPSDRLTAYANATGESLAPLSLINLFSLKGLA